MEQNKAPDPEYSDLIVLAHCKLLGYTVVPTEQHGRWLFFAVKNLTPSDAHRILGSDQHKLLVQFFAHWQTLRRLVARLCQPEAGR